MRHGSGVGLLTMRNNVTLTADDEGNVRNHKGDHIGRVTTVENGIADMDPAPVVTDGIRSKLGWVNDAEDTYQLDTESIESGSDTEIHLSR